MYVDSFDNGASILRNHADDNQDEGNKNKWNLMKEHYYAAFCYDEYYSMLRIIDLSPTKLKINF